MNAPNVHSVPCALVVAGGESPAPPESVVVVFQSAGEAEEFAGRHGIDDWSVAPLTFAVDMDREIRKRRGAGRPG